MEQATDLYLDLMKKCLTNWIYGTQEMEKDMLCKNLWQRGIYWVLKRKGKQLFKPKPMIPELREIGRDHPSPAHTLIGLKRLDNIQYCVENVLSNNIPGDLMECGVYRGGASIFMRAILKAHNIKDRLVYLADSFEGCPKPDIEKYPIDKRVGFLYKELAASLEEVKANFASYGLLDEQVSFIKGWFKDTLPSVAVENLAVLRLDGDLYESTMEALTNLYKKLSIGGYLIIDDFGALYSCQRAVFDYRKANEIKDKIITIDWTGIYWQKSK